MLILPYDSHWDPPKSVATFRDIVAKALGSAWHVRLTAYDNDAPVDPESISAAVLASDQAGLSVHVSRHFGGDTILVQLGSSQPVPFEDLAVAKSAVQIEQLLDSVRPIAPDDNLEPLIPLVDALRLLQTWRSDLTHDLNPLNAEFAATLRNISDKVMEATGLFADN